MNNLIYKYRSENYTPEEFEQIKQILLDTTSNQQLDNDLITHWENCAQTETVQSEEFDRIWMNIEQAINTRPEGKTPNLMFKKTLLIFSRVAAVLIVPMAIALFYLLHDKQNRYTNMADNVVKVSRASVSRLHLPDGTQVWLNAGSKLSYNSNFNQKERNINLEGEAYFEVTKNPKKPFIVRGKEMAVKVLGTKFDVKSYHEDAAVSVTLVEGSVHLSDSEKPDSNQVILKPNEQAVYSKSDSKLKINKVNAKMACEWINGNLIFDNEEFGQIMNCLEREYNVTIKIKDSEIAHIRFYGKFKNTQSLEEILNIMTAHQKFHYSKHERTIIVQKN